MYLGSLGVGVFPRIATRRSLERLPESRSERPMWLAPATPHPQAAHSERKSPKEQASVRHEAATSTYTTHGSKRFTPQLSGSISAMRKGGATLFLTTFTFTRRPMTMSPCLIGSIGRMSMRIDA
jgi:hypothetical protein